MDDASREFLQSQDWENIFPKLLRFCLGAMGKHGKTRTQLIGKACDAHDIAIEAVLAVIEGRRQWKPERGDLLLFLQYSVVRGIISNLKGSKEVALLESLSFYYEDEYGFEAEEITRSAPSLATPSAEEDATNNECLKELMAVLESTVVGLNKAEAKEVYECILEGITKPAEIEELTGIPALKVSEIKRQIKNKVSDIYERQ